MKYPVVGAVGLVLECNTDISPPPTKFEWYKGAIEQGHTSAQLTIPSEIVNSDEYKCVAVDITGKKSAKSPGTTIAFQSKFFVYVHRRSTSALLMPKVGGFVTCLFIK